MRLLFLLLTLAGAAAQGQFSPAFVANFHPRTAGGPPPPDLVFSDFHYSANFPSNTLTLVRTTNGPTVGIYWDDGGSFVWNTDAITTYDLFWIVEGTSSYVTNWLSTMAGGTFADPGNVSIDLDGHSTGYGTGANPINSSVGLEGFGDGSTYEVDSGTITPIIKLWMHAVITLYASENDALYISRFTITFNQ